MSRRGRDPIVRMGALALLSAGLVGALPHGESAADESKPRLEPYGFLRLDYIYDDSRMASVQSGFWALSEDTLAAGPNNAESSLHPRLTRVGMRLHPYEIGDDASARGTLEIDFQNGGSSESRPAMRMRHGFFDIRVGGFQFLGGQTWDLVSPLFPSVNDDALQWNAGNLGDRRPQARATWQSQSEKSGVTLAAALGMTGAVSNADLDKNLVLDGQDVGLPHAQARVTWQRRLDAERRLEAGVWGMAGRAEGDRPINGQTEFETWSLGLDLSIPLGAKATLQGEGWTGQLLSDVRGGIGQDVNKMTGSEVRSSGGWGQFVIKPGSKVELVGGGSIDDPRDEDLLSLADVQASMGTLAIGDVGRSLNWSGFGSIKVRPWSAFRVAFEYIYWRTDYLGLESGINNRVNMNFALYF